MRHHALDLQVQNPSKICTAADRSPRYRRTPSRCTGCLNGNPLHARLIEVNSQMTEKVRDLEQTVSGYKDNQWNPHAGIDFSKIEADLTELKTFLYKQQRLARETRSQEAKD